MAILKRINLIFCLVICLLCTSCTVEKKCTDLNGAFVIRNWEGPAPKRAELIQYKKNSEFRIVEKSTTDLNIQKEFNKFMNYTLIQVTPNNLLPIDADYLLILDGSTEYKIINIISSERGDLGCPLKSAQVNACKGDVSYGIHFDKNCGTPVSAN